jgi:prepilin signal peptidase PulO-like enzyme (type II secretory pathway)
MKRDILMALIEQIEKNALKQVVKNKWLYLTIALFQLPLIFTNTQYSMPLLILLGVIFAIVFCIDVKEYIIPDSAQIAIFLTANGLIYFSDYRDFTESYFGFIFAGLLFLAIYYFGAKLFKKQILGFGDVKLFASVGLLLGLLTFNYFLWVLTFSSALFVLLKKILKKDSKVIPYGPFIVSSAWVCLIYKDNLDTINYIIMTYIFS